MFATYGRPPAAFETRVTRAAALTLVEPSGELDLVTAGAFTQALEDALSDRPLVIGIDLRQLAFMDSSGVRALLLANTRCQEAGLRYFLIRGGGQVSMILEISGLENLLEVVDSPEALAGA